MTSGSAGGDGFRAAGAPAQRGGRRAAPGVRRARTAGLVAAAALAGGIAGALGGLLLGDGWDAGPAVTRPVAATLPPPTAVGLTAEAVYRRSAPGVVAITGVRAGKGAAALGSGFVLDGRGDVATGYDVVAGAERLRVGIDGTSYPAALVGVDPSAGVAVVRAEAPAGLLHPLALEPSGRLSVGDAVYALGDRAGVGRTMTAGIVGALGAREGRSAIETDAAIDSAAAGGPLLDRYGRVVGIDEASAAGAALAVGVQTARPALHRLVARALGMGVA